MSTSANIEKQKDAFAGMIGGLLLNFGALEFLSYRWVEILSTDPIARDLAIDMLLGKRIELIKRLVERCAWPEDKKAEAVSLWNDVVKLTKLRNKVAHNPLITESGPNGTIVFGVI